MRLPCRKQGTAALKAYALAQLMQLAMEPEGEAASAPAAAPAQAAGVDPLHLATTLSLAGAWAAESQVRKPCRAQPAWLLARPLWRHAQTAWVCGAWPQVSLPGAAQMGGAAAAAALAGSAPDAAAAAASAGGGGAGGAAQV